MSMANGHDIAHAGQSEDYDRGQIVQVVAVITTYLVDQEKRCLQLRLIYGIDFNGQISL